MSRDERRALALQYIADQIAAGAAARLRVKAEEVAPVVRAVVDYLSETYGGQELYFPSDRRRQRAAAILDAIDKGMPMHRICSALGVSKATVRRVARQVTAIGPPAQPGPPGPIAPPLKT